MKKVLALLICSVFWFGMDINHPDYYKPFPTLTPTASCTDGVDCFCDKIKNYRKFKERVVFCEDFEDPALNTNDTSYNPNTGWLQKYNGIVNGCWESGVEGTCSTCCINIVQEGACEVTGESDCVFDGGNSLGHRLQPGKTGGIVGTANWNTVDGVRDFSITYAIKYSSNFVDPTTAMKTNEFGERDSCILGCSTSQCNFGRIIPFQVGGIRFKDNITSPVGTHIVGSECIYGGNGYKLIVSGYSWGNPKGVNDDFGPGEWGCFTVQFIGYGTGDASWKIWFKNKLIAHVENVDMTYAPWDINNNKLSPDHFGLKSHKWNHYYNDGFTGSTVAYRYEDNFIIVTGKDPFPCSGMGF